MTLIYFSQTISSLLERLEFSYLLSIIIYSLIYFTYLLFFVIYPLIYFTYPRGILEEDCRQSIHNTTEAKHARSLERKKAREWRTGSCASYGSASPARLQRGSQATWLLSTTWGSTCLSRVFLGVCVGPPEARRPGRALRLVEGGKEKASFKGFDRAIVRLWRREGETYLDRIVSWKGVDGLGGHMGRKAGQGQRLTVLALLRPFVADKKGGLHAGPLEEEVEVEEKQAVVPCSRCFGHTQAQAHTKPGTPLEAH